MTRPATDPMSLTHRAHRPHYESRPYRPSPARREFINGRILPADEVKSDPSRTFAIYASVFVAAWFVAALIMGRG